MNSTFGSEEYEPCTLETRSSTVVWLRQSSRLEEINLEDLDYFRVVSEGKRGWRLEFSQEEVLQPTLRVTNHEVGSDLLYRAWLACPRTRPLNLRNRPQSRAVLRLEELGEEIVFVPVENGKRRRFTLSKLQEPALHGTSIGTTWKWWFELGEEDEEPLRFYTLNSLETYEKLISAWMQQPSR